MFIFTFIYNNKFFLSILNIFILVSKFKDLPFLRQLVHSRFSHLGR